MYKDVVAVLHQLMRSASKKHVLHAHLHRLEHLENAHTSRIDKDHCASDADIAALQKLTDTSRSIQMAGYAPVVQVITAYCAFQFRTFKGAFRTISVRWFRHLVTRHFLTAFRDGQRNAFPSNCTMPDENLGHLRCTKHAVDHNRQ